MRRCRERVAPISPGRHPFLRNPDLFGNTQHARRDEEAHPFVSDLVAGAVLRAFGVLDHQHVTVSRTAGVRDQVNHDPIVSSIWKTGHSPVHQCSPFVRPASSSFISSGQTHDQKRITNFVCVDRSIATNVLLRS